MAAGIAIILGITFMRFAYALVYYNISVLLIILGAILFLAGVIFFARTLFHNNKR